MRLGTEMSLLDIDAQEVEALRALSGEGDKLLNAVDVGVSCLDASGVTLFVNDAGARMLGYTPREMRGKSQHALVHARYPDGTPFPEEACPIKASVSDGVHHRIGGDVFWRKDGVPLPVDYTSIPIRDGKRILGAVITFRDISDQQAAAEQAARLASERAARAEAERAQRALEQSEASFRFLTESLPVQVWTSAPNGQLDYVTNQVSDYFGLSREQILRDGWQDVVHADDLSAAVTAWVHSLTTGTPYSVEFRLRSASGQYLWHLARALPQRDEAGTIIKWYGTNTDIEVQKRSRD